MGYDILEMKSISKILNNRTFTDYYYRLKLMATSVFKWEGLPKGMDERWIENYLFSEGSCMFFESDKGWMITKCTKEGFNYWDDPVDLRPVATGYTTDKKFKNGEDAVLIRNNDMMIPTHPTIELYAYKLADLSRTIDINVNAQKTPILIQCSDKKLMTMKNIYAQWNGFEPVIYAAPELDTESVKVFRTDAPVVFDKLQIQKHQIWNECMTFLSINNANQDKRERLVADEVQANNEQVVSNAMMMLKAREKACEEINRIFGLNIKVSLRIPQNQIMEVSEGSETGSETDESEGGEAA